LTQTVGEKEVLLFNPKDAKNLYLDGDKSECIGLISNLKENLERFPKLFQTTAFREVLKPGDVLFIPALWFHCTKAQVSNMFISGLGSLSPKNRLTDRFFIPSGSRSRQVFIDRLFHGRISNSKTKSDQMTGPVIVFQ
jgi:hypothetical protein